VKCPQCDAEVKVPPGAAEADCPYCGAAVARPAQASADPFGALFADADGNGIPDFMEKLGAAGGSFKTSASVSGTVSQTFVVNGVKYDSLEAMPPEARRLFEGLNLPAAAGAARAATAIAQIQAGPSKRQASPRVVVVVLGLLLAAAGFLGWLLLSR
jgi:hypothetical protein